MGIKRSVEFKQEAVRVALTSGQSRREVAANLGVGFSTLGKWISQYGKEDLISSKDMDLAKENERLRRENRLLKEEREVLKKAAIFFAKEKL
jgi:transposase